MFMYLLPVVTSTKDYYTVELEKRERERERDQKERLEKERGRDRDQRERGGRELACKYLPCMHAHSKNKWVMLTYNVGCLSCTQYLSHDNSQNNPSNFIVISAVFTPLYITISNQFVSNKRT